jgi:hypothetical protein
LNRFGWRKPVAERGRLLDAEAIAGSVNELRLHLRGEHVQNFVGKTAFVTGGASGIGVALGQAFAEAGMNVMLADIEQVALTTAVERLGHHHSKVRGIICDVADPASMEKPRPRRSRFSEMCMCSVTTQESRAAAG